MKKQIRTSNFIGPVIRICILIIFTVCIYLGKKTKNTYEDSASSIPAPTDVSATEESIFEDVEIVEIEEPEEIDEEKQKLIDKYQVWLDMPENQLILADTFATPEEADWDKILYQAAMGGISRNSFGC